MLRDERRFWDKVDNSVGPDACWEWQACKNRAGYGPFRVGGKLVLAHRFAFELKHGPIPDGLCACHRCDNPGCVNPAHIFLGTCRDNAVDREAKGRGNQPRGDRHGSRLHPEKRAIGERNGNAKLTEAQAAEIRAAYAVGGVTHRELGRRFGVAHTQIGRVVRGKSYQTPHTGEEKSA